MSARLLLLFMLAGCAGAPRPTVRSAASPDHAAAPPVDVGHALRGEPPLPGEATDGWPGLEPASATPEGHHHAH